MSTTTTTTRLARHPATDHPRQAFRPWYRWLLTALAFPPAGYVATLVAGRVDSVMAAAVGGLIAGTGIGAAQWALLRHRRVHWIWIPATAVGLCVGLATGAPLVSYRTDISSLVLMGVICGLGVGVAQGATLGGTKRLVLWSAATATLWAIGWTATTLGGIHVEEQFVVFGAYGCFSLALLQSVILHAFVPAEPVTS
jgi:hypothetical protein